jgi:hypothetical protein
MDSDPNKFVQESHLCNLQTDFWQFPNLHKTRFHLTVLCSEEYLDFPVRTFIAM